MKINSADYNFPFFLTDVKNYIEQKKRELYLIKRGGSSIKDGVSGSLLFVKIISLTEKAQLY